jgi:hypothetical protein
MLSRTTWPNSKANVCKTQIITIIKKMATKHDDGKIDFTMVTSLLLRGTLQSYPNGAAVTTPKFTLLGAAYMLILKFLELPQGDFTHNDYLTNAVRLIDEAEYGKDEIRPLGMSGGLLRLTSQVRMFGAKKYARDNWKKGFKYTRALAAALRHLFSAMYEDPIDPESGLLHIGHAVCSIEHCYYAVMRLPPDEFDDRGTSEEVVTVINVSWTPPSTGPVESKPEDRPPLTKRHQKLIEAKKTHSAQ